jgi:cysteine-rich repeat protein
MRRLFLFLPFFLMAASDSCSFGSDYNPADFGPPGCGDGRITLEDMVSGAEVCDSGGRFDDPNCRADCRGKKICGDGFLDVTSAEECDDGNLENNDGCKASCLLQTNSCFNGISEPGEVCYSQEIVFNLPQSDVAFAATTGDFNNDGDKDFATVSKSSNVRIFINNNLGGFLGETTIATGVSPSSIKSADVDNDSDLDLVVANAGSSSISVLYNDSTGNFLPNTPLVVGSSPQFVLLEDFNQDSQIDIFILTKQFNTDKITVIPNQGNGVFDTFFTVDTLTNPISIDGFDFNKDSFLDIVIFDSNDKFSVHINQGDDIFSIGIVFDIISSFWIIPGTPAIGDFDQDSNMDIAVFNSAFLEILNQKENNEFGLNSFSSLPFGFADIIAKDINGDSFSDLIVNTENGVLVLLNDKAEGFLAGFVLNQSNNRVSLGEANDLNGDQIIDLITNNGVFLSRP